MKISHASFLNAIACAPEDDTPRLIYADYLEDLGDLDRAEFIRLQIALARYDSLSVRPRAMLKREQELLVQHGEAWTSAFPKNSGPVFNRGFVETVTLDLQEFAKRGKKYFAVAPLQTVHLRGEGMADTIGALSRCPNLDRLRGLGLYECSIGSPDAARQLFDLPGLKNVRTLVLGEEDATQEIAQVLAEGCLPALEELCLWDFHSGNLGCAGLSTLATSPALGGLQRLRLLHNGIRHAGVEALAASPYLTRLEILSLGERACGYAPNRIGILGARALAGSSSLRALHTLSLDLNELADDALITLAHSSTLVSLRSLSLSANHITDVGMQELARSERLAGLTFLNLSTNNIGARGVIALASAESARQLELLWLVQNPIGLAGLHALAESNTLPGLRTLGLSLTPEVAWQLEKMEGFDQVKELRLFVQGIDEPLKAALRERFEDRVTV